MSSRTPDRPALAVVGGPHVRSTSEMMMERARFRLARRRRTVLLGCASLATLSAAARAGGVASIMWAGLVVVPAFALAVKPRPVRAGAIGALLAGPVLMPLVVGRAWGAWQTVAMLAASAAALLPPRSLLR